MNPLRAAAEYAAFRGILAPFRFLGQRAPAAISSGARLGDLVRGAGIRARIVRENLARAFPEKDAAAREAILRDTYRHFGRLLVEAGNLSRWSEDEWRERVVIENWDLLEKNRREGRGVVVLVGHFGAYDVGGGRLSLDGRKVMSVYQPVHNPHVQRDILAIRSLYGGRTADARMGLREVIRFLREQGVVFMLSDEDTGPKGAFVPFFGHPASSHRGPVEIARRTGAAIVTGFVRAHPDGNYRGGFETQIPMGSDEEVLTEYHRRLEAHIRMSPEQYFWFHRRWKTPAPA